MKIKTKLLLGVAFLFTLLSLVFWYLSKSLSDKMDQMWAQRYIKKQIIFDKYRTLLPITNEIKLVKRLSHEPALIAMAKNESDPIIRAKGFAKLEEYRTLFQNRSYFAAFTATNHYYYDDAKHQSDNQKLRYTLSNKNPNDKWFFTTLATINDLGINVDKDDVLDVTKIWINYILKDGNKTLGIIGTGFDFSDFINQSVGLEQDGIANYFIDDQMAIQLAKESSMIDYASITKENGDHKTINSLFDDANDITQIKQMMQTLHNSKVKDEVLTTFAKIDGKNQLIGVTYLQEIGWFNITIIDTKELVIFSNTEIFFMLVALLALFILILERFHNHLLIKPINKLKLSMQKIQNNEDVELTVIGTGEIAELSLQFKTMVDYIENYNEQLEAKIEERTDTLAKSEQKFHALFDLMHEALILLNRNGFFECNRAALELFGCPDYETFCSLHPSDISPLMQSGDIESAVLAQKHIDKAYHDGENRFEWIHRRYDNKQTFYAEVFLSRIEIHGEYALQAIVRDVSKRKQDEEAIKLLAFYDPLTLLPNRRLLDDRLMHAIDICKRRNETGAIMFLDLDNFKPLNDEHGHDAGDLLLVETASRIRSCIRESDTVARFGGDEFVILLEGTGVDRQKAFKHSGEIAKKILDNIEQSYYIQRNTGMIKHHCSASIGITIFDQYSTNRDKIIKEADIAMYAAKESGRGQFYFYK